MIEVSEQYSSIAEPFEQVSSDSKIVSSTQDPRIGTDLNAHTRTIPTINPTNDWLLPSKRYLTVEGQLLKSSGTVLVKDALVEASFIFHFRWSRQIGAERIRAWQASYARVNFTLEKMRIQYLCFLLYYYAGCAPVPVHRCGPQSLTDQIFSRCLT